MSIAADRERLPFALKSQFLWQYETFLNLIADATNK